MIKNSLIEIRFQGLYYFINWKWASIKKKKVKWECDILIKTDSVLKN
jgi:hypothetical protein